MLTTDAWRQTFDYTSLGNLDQEQLPCRWSGSACLETPVQLARTFHRGWLTGVTGWIDSVDYHDNGMLHEIDFAGNGPVYRQDKDPDQIQRPGSYGLTGGADIPLSYDGMGSVKGVGPETYRYDLQSRLVQATLGSAESQTYAYDPFGNLTQIARSGYTTTLGALTDPQIVSPTNRQAGSANYDAAGNLTRSAAGIDLEWDALSMMTRNAASGDSYVYTADDERVGILGNGGDTWRLRDLRGYVVREYGPSSASDITIFADGFESGDPFCWSEGTAAGTYGQCFQLTTSYLHELGLSLASDEVGRGKVFNLLTHLGTVRQMYDADGSVVANVLAFPYGEILCGGQNGTDCPDPETYSPLFFTGHERDLNGEDSIPADDDLDYMHARNYWPLYGRFTSVDPVSGTSSSPQTWNRNAYVHGNPMTLVDPSGMFAIPLAGIPYDFLCSMHPSCIPYLNEPSHPYPGVPDVAGQWTEPGSDVSMQHSFNPFNVELARGFYANLQGSDSPWQSFVGASATDFLDFAGIQRQNDLALAIALGPIPHTRALQPLRHGVGGFRISPSVAAEIAAKGITVKQVATVLRKGARHWDPKEGISVFILKGHYSRGHDLVVALNPTTKTVATAIATRRASGRFVPWP